MLELDNISVHFGGVRALHQVSLRADAGETVGLVGPNGAGKTTLFNVISGVVKPSGGRIVFAGRHIRSGRQHIRARLGIGRTFQVPQPLHELTVRENLLVAQRFGTGRAVDHERIDAVLAAVGLTERQHADAAGGLALTERKALEVAKALATEPRLLMLDEVFAGLETHGKRRFMDTLVRIRSEFDLTLLVIEHDIETIRSLCDRVAVLNFGEMLAEGDPDEVFNHPEVIRSYTGETAA